MAIAPHSRDARADSALRSLAGEAARTVVPPVQFLGYCAAVSLPLAYVPLLAGGLSGDVVPFAALLFAHVVALVVGHGYDR
jgi:hypothetical protein